jgi:O-methyltransferase
VLDRLGDDAGLSSVDGNGPLVCTRALLVDEAVRAFLAAHPDAAVAHLGCGLDSRVLRIDPGPGVAWVEVDQEPVVALRRSLYPARPSVTTVAASVASASWAAAVPTGRPLLVVAEGLLMYLPPSVLRTVVATAFGLDAPVTQLVADTVAPWVRRIAGRSPAFREAGTGFASTTDDLLNVLPAGLHRESRSLVVASGARTRGPVGAITRALAVVPPGREAMVLHRLTARS